MHFSVASAVVAVSSLALLSSSRVSAALTAKERAAYELTAGPEPNFCDPCLSKAMHNHFPHACEAGLDSKAANKRRSGPTDAESRCICVAFQDLSWMKADCSAECPYVFNEKTMSFFMPSSKIKGCDRWIDFAVGKEKLVDGFAPKDDNHTPEVFEIAPAPPLEVSHPNDVMDEDGHFKVSVHVNHDEKKKAELEAKEAEEKQEEAKGETESKTESKKDEL
ncbi:hypothetical protein BGX21_009754 [Mortierella sp. AD011]|nr:hypothetical protein BGX20_009449 [Mortierella sp. AD010]KAF9395809.1 hypothetical protein BGX21_009754 [Mortierella sp. AD011]